MTQLLERVKSEGIKNIIYPRFYVDVKKILKEVFIWLD